MDRHQYEMLYRNQRPVDSSSEEDESSEEDTDEMKIKYTKKTFNFFIDSADRDWTGLYVKTFDFQVKFGVDSDTFETYKKNIINNDLYELHIQKDKYLGSKSLAFPINVKNIESISIQSLIMPKRLYYLGGANYMDLLDFRYLLLSVEEISNCYYGTNSNINKSIAIMFPLSSVYKSTTVPNHIEFKDKGHMIKEFKPTPLNCFDNLKFTINDPNGNPLRFKNDILTINKIVTGADEFITITTNDTFNGEYINGDLIKIKGFSTSDSIDKSFLDFINREEGHIIYRDTGSSTTFADTTFNSTDILFNTFQIIAPGDYTGTDSVANDKFARASYVPNNATLSSDVTGTILNTSLQFSLFLKVETRVMEFNSLNAQII
jgi:hypothetical protein